MLSRFGHPGREIQIKVAFLPSGRGSIARTHLLAEALVDALGPVEGALAGHGPTLFLQKSYLTVNDTSNITLIITLTFAVKYVQGKCYS